MRVLIADDHPLYREAAALQLKRLHADVTIDEVSSLDELRGMAASGAAYDLILMDYYMPGVSAAAIAALVRDHPSIPLAVMSGSASRADIRAAVASGARAFIPKTAGAEHFASALQMLLAGGSSIPAEMLTAGGTAWEAVLTVREQEVLAAITKGLSNKEIGRELGLAEVTVKLHLRNLFRKMAVKSRAEAAVKAVKSGLG